MRMQTRVDREYKRKMTVLKIAEVTENMNTNIQKIQEKEIF